MCFGLDKEPLGLEVAPAMQQYPSTQDARSARAAGGFYGTSHAPFSEGHSAVLLGHGVPVSGLGATTNQVTAPINATAHADHSTPNSDILADVYARAGLAANRSAVAGLGYDPRNFSMDGFLNAEQVNIGGVYSPDDDHGYVIPGGSADAASTLIHESMHRGVQKLREAGKFPEGSPFGDEESLVRILMQGQMGDPEQSESAVRMKRTANANANWHGDRARNDYLRQLEAAAADMVAKRKPGGPW